MNNRKAPRIRFKGFTDDWEQRKLGKVADKVTEKNSGLQYLETLTNSAEFGIISQRDFFDHDISKTTSLGGYYIVRSEDFVYNPRISVTAPVGPINRNKLGRTGVMSPLYTVFRPHDVDTTYLEHFFKSSCWHSFMNFNGDSGARSDRFSIKDNVFFEMPIPTPDIEEQGQIGECLTHLDHLITLHQRKLEKLKIVKKAMLENCFPKNGEKVPKFRFSGFTGDWEQRKLGKVFEEYSEKNHEDLPTLMIIQGGGTIRRDESDRSLLYDKANLANYKMVNEGDFIVHLRSFEGGLEMATNTGIISPAYHTFHGENTDSRFYYSYFRSKKFIDIDLTPHVYGIRDGRSIDIEGMKTVKIPFTSYEEQKAIGMFIKHLDHLITLHQRKLEKLKIIKKSFLEKMFV